MTADTIQALVDDLQRERAVVDDRLRLATELLATYDVDPLDETTIPLDDEPVNIVGKKAKPKAPKPTAERVACPDCGQMFHKQGIGSHRASKHPSSAAKPVRLVPDRPAHRDPLDEFGDKAYACTTCNHEEPNVNGMKRHTLVEHGRPLNDTERQAVAS